ncbi:MAG TPA: ATP-binding protein [Mycobacteriales bacterium]|nr:ATP-binding protein [Mycobacteriales bacterium]
MTLRARLLAALLALLAAVSLIVGVVSVLALNSFLVGRLDSQLAAAVGRIQDGGPGPSRPTPSPGASGSTAPGDGGGFGGGPPGLLVAGQAEGTLGALISGGQVSSAAVVNSAGGGTSLTTAQEQVLLVLPADGRSYERGLGGDLGDYRLRAVTGPDGGEFVAGLPLSGVHDTVTRLSIVIAAVAASGLLLAGFAGAVIVRLTLRPLRRVAATATRVSELPLARGAVDLSERVAEADTDPRTEVGQVGAALNRMLGHVSNALTARQESETRVRQFVADASHELRTPLASIRGYAELTRRGRDPVPPDVAYALGRVESESTRMTGLVEDLLLLARLDNAHDGGPAVAHEPVDLSRLVVDAVSDARVAGADHDWALELPPDPVEVRGDGDRLHQVVANLLGNARTHTPAGSTVTVGLSIEDGSVLLRVTDDGPGIPPELLPRVFERFARGDGSRSRAAGSTGLGLAIVSAVTDAHGGTVAVDSSPAGTAFTVRLPSSPVGDADGSAG